jgi:branched-chain amino acid transport system ATP-binding protein
MHVMVDSIAEPILRIERLHKSFGALHATDNISLDLRKGEIHALIGPNGAGKSTLIAQIAGSLKPDRGQIFLDGEDVTHLSVAARAVKGLGRCFQVSSLAMPLSVRRNVMIASQAISGSSFRFWKAVESDKALIAAADEAIETMGLLDRADVPVSFLSHGERRQLEVGCALALKPKLLLLDEPMAGMGAGGSERFTMLLESLKHDMDAVFRLADRISVLVYGQIVAHGTAEQIRHNPLVREAYLGVTDEVDD